MLIYSFFFFNNVKDRQKYIIYSSLNAIKKLLENFCCPNPSFSGQTSAGQDIQNWTYVCKNKVRHVWLILPRTGKVCFINQIICLFFNSEKPIEILKKSN
jgi:hypothetical protein